MRGLVGFLAGIAVALTVPAGAAKVRSHCVEVITPPPVVCDAITNRPPVECRKS